MSIVRISFFIALSIIFCSISVTYCHPNESGIKRYQSQKLSRLFKRETLSDVYHSLETFENDEESLPDNLQTPLKRSIHCKSISKEKTKESEAEKNSVDPNIKLEFSARVDNNSNSVLSSNLPTITLALNDSPIEDPPSNKTCMRGVFQSTDKFFDSVDENLKLLSQELSAIFNNLSNKTSELLAQITNSDFLDPSKCKAAKNISIFSSNLAEQKEKFLQIFPIFGSINNGLASLRTSDPVPIKISTCIENIRNNVTDYVGRMQEKVGLNNDYINNFLNQLKSTVNPLKNFNFTIFDSLKDKLNIINGTKNQTRILEQLNKQNVALGILGQFLNKLTRGINGFFHVIMRKWSHENKHPHHHGLVGSIKNVFGWPSHAYPDPPFYQKIFSLPNFHSKHHDEHVPLLKKIFKIPNYHHHHHRHHHHPGSLISHLLHSLYSIFHFTDHCECPQGSNSATSCPVNHFFNWLGGKPTPHHQHHHKNVPGHINLHHNVMKHKQPACSCS